MGQIELFQRNYAYSTGPCAKKKEEKEKKKKKKVRLTGSLA